MTLITMKAAVAHSFSGFARFSSGMFLLGALGMALPAMAQEPLVLDAAEYDRMKAQGEVIPDRVTLREGSYSVALPRTRTQVVRPKGGSLGSCDLWQDPTPCTQAFAPHDDLPSLQVSLPFTFNLYGQEYTSLWINNNGNVTFDAAYGTFSANPFPNNAFVMVAPFWGDVDTGDPNNELGVVSYCVDDHRMVVTWDSVGYYNTHGDLRNTFQLIITDGTDPLIGIGNNVCFNYQDMTWTTGDASQGVNGFGGIPAVVGANLGDGVSYIQIGTFDHEGTDYDGPIGANDGVSWLDYRSFVFSTVTPIANIPPLVSGNVLCDTIRLCDSETFDFGAEFYSPEPDQTTSITVDGGGLSSFTITTQTSGITANIAGTIVASLADIGFHTVTITGTDTGTPEGVTSLTFVVQVIPAPGEPPVIYGDAFFCEEGVAYLNVLPLYDTYEWSFGSVGPNVSVYEPGTYTVTVTNGGECSLTSLPFVVTEVPRPSPVITGSNFSCGGTPVVLSTTESFSAYSWSNGSGDPSITVGTGDYTVSVTSDDGCVGESLPFSVVVANDPTAFYFTDPASPQVNSAVVTFNDQSTVEGGSIVSWQWVFGNAGVGSGPNPTQAFTAPGQYPITLTVTTADGCTATFQGEFVILPPGVSVPNVISPNGDNSNDYLVIDNIEYWSNELSIFDRWGAEVYSARNYRNQWKADDLPDGTYYYVLTLSDGDELKGHLTVLR